MDFLIKLGKNISRIRNGTNLTQANLAEKADVSISTIGRIEIGDGFPQMETLKKIATALSVELEDLFDFIPPVDNSMERTALITELEKQASKATKPALVYFITMISEYNKSLENTD